jgi:hypothetical protein
MTRPGSCFLPVPCRCWTRRGPEPQILGAAELAVRSLLSSLIGVQGAAWQMTGLRTAHGFPHMGRWGSGTDLTMGRVLIPAICPQGSGDDVTTSIRSQPSPEHKDAATTRTGLGAYSENITLRTTPATRVAPSNAPRAVAAASNISKQMRGSCNATRPPFD